MTAAAGGLLGSLFFLWIAGPRIVVPTQFGWLMQLDWRIHFLGWHFFRRESWHWPPGRIAGYFAAPDGTTIGFTDSIPLVAFALKPFSGVLPDVFQYFGVWLMACFALQGVFGVLLARLWTTNRALQLMAAAFFVLMPTLLIRVGHPSLCAHFLLLWALWMYWRPASATRPPIAAQAALGLVAGLVHPYLAVMVLALLAALAIRARAASGWLLATAGVLAGWWLAGLFTASGPDSLATEGLGYYSMNLLGPVTPAGWSTLLPEQATTSPGQAYEGFQYLGAGALLLIAVSLVMAVRHLPALEWSAAVPVLLVSMTCAAYALSPVVTLGAREVASFAAWTPDWFAIFRATGRFFWPAAYLLLTLAIGVIVSRLRAKTAAAVLAVALALQVIDLRTAHAERRATSRSEAFHAQQQAWSPLWARALPQYEHVVMVNPPHCGEAAAAFEWPAFLAGLHGLTINAGEVARPDPDKVAAYCRELAHATRAGIVRDDSLYLVAPAFVPAFREGAQVPVECVTIDAIPVCMTSRSYQPWRPAAIEGSTP